jgi:hypothetical protein
MKKVRSTHYTLALTFFFILWRKQLFWGVGDRQSKERESHRGKNTKSGGNAPTFSAFSRPKS